LPPGDESVGHSPLGMYFSDPYNAKVSFNALTSQNSLDPANRSLRSECAIKAIPLNPDFDEDYYLKQLAELESAYCRKHRSFADALEANGVVKSIVKNGVNWQRRTFMNVSFELLPPDIVHIIKSVEPKTLKKN
jgi:hypothetical protein